MYQWFKFYGSEFLSDPKIVPLNAGERSCWITLLCFASQTENGVVRFINEEQLKAMSGIIAGDEMWIKCTGILEKLKNADMITLSNGNVTIKNWVKRQYSEGYLRVKAYRKRNSNAEVTPQREKEREKEYTAKADYRESPKTTAKETADNLKRLAQ